MSLKCQLLDAISRIACLGFEKSYRETVVLMTRSYLDQLRTVGSAESKTLPPEAMTERVEVSLEILPLSTNYLKCSFLMHFLSWSRLFLKDFFSLHLD